jgi:hypothetical protein
VVIELDELIPGLSYTDQPADPADPSNDAGQRQFPDHRADGYRAHPMSAAPGQVASGDPRMPAGRAGYPASDSAGFPPSPYGLAGSAQVGWTGEGTADADYPTSPGVVPHPDYGPPDTPAYDRAGYSDSRYPDPGYPDPGYPDPGHDETGYDGYPAEPYPVTGYPETIYTDHAYVGAGRAADEVAEPAPADPDAAPEVGFTGARFGSPGARKRRWGRGANRTGAADSGAAAGAAPSESAEPAETPFPRRRPTGARFGSPADRDRRWGRGTADPDPEAAAPPLGEVPALAQITGHGFGGRPGAVGADDDYWAAGADEDPDEFSGADEGLSLVRPYTWTAGRTTAGPDLQIETMVHLDRQTDGAVLAALDVEHRSVIEACRAPRSVAEVSAMLAVPLGVGRVLIGDLVTTGVLIKHEVAGDHGNPPTVALLERVLVGLRNL